MNKHLMQFLFVAFFVFFSLTGYALGNSPVESVEFKILLQPENFSSLKKGCEIFWEVVEKVAKEKNIKTKFSGKKIADRDICFLDTENFALYEKGFICRVRSEEIEKYNEEPLLEGSKGTELTLKFRAPDVESAVIAPVVPDPEFDDDVSFEEDVVVKLGQPCSVFSRSGTIANPKKIPSSVREIIELYPDMKRVKLDSSQLVKSVNGITVKEKRIKGGNVYFGDEKLKVLFSVWYKEGEKDPFIAEFSFKLKVGKRKKRSFADLDLAKEFFLELANKGKDLISPDQTKTGAVYQLK